MAINKENLYLSLQESINNDRHLQTIISKNNLTKEDLVKSILLIDKYLSRKNICKKCLNFEGCLQEDTKGFIYDISFSNESSSLKFKTCSKRQAVAKERGKFELLNKNFIVRDFAQEDLELTFWKIYKNIKFVNLITAYEKRLSDNLTKGFYFISDYKSQNKKCTDQMFIATANFLSKRYSKSICFIDMPTAVIEFTKHKKSVGLYGPEPYCKYNFEDNLKMCDFLFISNIGSEKFIEDFHAVTFLNMLTYRINNNLPTFICSSFTANEIYLNNQKNYERYAGQIAAIQNKIKDSYAVRFRFPDSENK